jgi:Transglutaminase-like superfamily
MGRGFRRAVTHPVISLIGKFFRLPRRDQLLLLEATLWMAVAGFGIVVLPFRHLGLLAARPIRRPEPKHQARALTVRRIRWAIVTASRRLPWDALCFQQGLAAQLMLRRRGIPSVLYYGAVSDDRHGLSAHVWVRDGDVDVIGGDSAYRYAMLATFPPQNAETSCGKP